MPPGEGIKTVSRLGAENATLWSLGAVRLWSHAASDVAKGIQERAVFALLLASSFQFLIDASVGEYGHTTNGHDEAGRGKDEPDQDGAEALGGDRFGMDSGC